MSVLLDTHAALWLVQGDERLGVDATEQMAYLPRDQLRISDLLLFETAMLVSKGRVEINEPLSIFMRDFSLRFLPLPVDADIAALAVELPLPQGDPFDRIFVATARRHNLPLVTRDRSIRDSGLVHTIW